MNRNLRSISKLSALTLALIAVAHAPVASAEDYELIDAKVVDTQYAGGQNVLVRWESYNWDDNTYLDRRGTSLGVVNGNPIYRRYSLFARELGGEYFLVKDLGSSTDRTWSGQISALNEYTPLQFQVREQHVDSGEYSEGLQAPGKVIDLTDIDLPPSIDHQGDQLDLEFEIDSGVVMWFENEEWATNISDGGDGTQKVFIEKVYDLGGRSSIVGVHNSFRPNRLWAGYGANRTPADGFLVLQPCDVSRHIPMGWMGACAPEIPVILSSKRLPGHANLPSVTMGNSVSVGDDYNMQEIPNWATNINAGDNATPDSTLRFHTVWVTNSNLFEVGPWVSFPSGTLRFKFKEGASGTSKMYVALADWDRNSPENLYAFRHEVEWSLSSQDLSADHSMIHTIEFSVGSNTQDKSISSGSRGADMQGVPSSDAELSTSNGGGGAAGLALLSLGLLSFSRRK